MFFLLKCRNIFNKTKLISVPAALKDLKVIPPITQFEEIDVSKALTTPGRLLYPKVAKRTRLDELLTRRSHLKILEERRIAQQTKQESDVAVPIVTPQVTSTAEEENVDVEGDDVDLETEGGLDKQLSNMMTGKVSAGSGGLQTPLNREVLNSITKRIQALRLHYTAISKLGKDYQCYSKGCNSNSSSLMTSCYSPLCLQRNKVRRELLGLLRKANIHTYATPKVAGLLGTPAKKPSILEQKLTAPQTPALKDKPTDASICKDLASAILAAPKCTAEVNNVYIPLKTKTDVKKEIKEEPMQVDEIKCDPQPPLKKLKMEDGNVDVDGITPDAIKEMILGAEMNSKEVTITTTTVVTTSQTYVDGVIKTMQASTATSDTMTVSNGSGRIQTLNAKSSVYSAQQNRRFCSFRSAVKREERVVKTEKAEDGTERVYSTVSTEGKIYLKKIPNVPADKKKKRPVIKYPISSTFQTKKGIKSVLVLPKPDIKKLARNAGRIHINGFHALAKPNNSVWPYPCARPLFKTCWIYRTVNLRSLAAVALQLRILWACLRWDDMQVKPPSTDGKHQITTETEILSLELLKHRHVGQFLEKTQYLRRKVVIPLELPKTVRGKLIESVVQNLLCV